MSSKTSDIICRPARPSDTSVVQAFLPGIWNGDDYVPGVWDSWLDSSEGLLVVAEYAGQTAGLGRLRDLGWGEWWMEGLRVDPQFQGLGIASRLHEYLIDRWLESGGSVVRLATHARRRAVRHLCGRTGFQKVALLGYLYAEARESGHAFLPEQVDALPRRVSGMELGLKTTRGEELMDLDWAWASLRQERVRNRPGASFWSWQDGEGWAVLREESYYGDEGMLLQAYGVQMRHIIGFLSDLRALVFQLGQTGLHSFAPFELATKGLWHEAGWTRDADEELLLFERWR